MHCFVVLLVLALAPTLLTAGEDGGEHIRQRFEDMRMRRIPRGGVVDMAARSRAIDIAQRASLRAPEQVLDARTWKSVGPMATAGRIKSIIVDPTTPNVIYAAAAAGGVWKSTNGGDSWMPMMDDANGIAMGTLAFDPSSPSTIYAGTGEQVTGANIFLGAGLLRSTNAGTTWEVVGLTSVGSCSRIMIPPSQPSTIYVAGMNEHGGLWKSTDRGLTWKRIAGLDIYDASLHPTNHSTIIMAMRDVGIIRSIDGGATWEPTSGLTGRIGRISVQHAPSNGSIVYALCELDDRATIAASRDGGATWRVVYRDSTGCFFAGTCQTKDSQGFYDNVIAVCPTSPDTVIAGGIDLLRTTDGGATWSNVTQGYADGNGNNHPHVDQHAICFDPHDPSHVWAGNDGGIMESRDAGATWLPRNNGLAVTQFYAVDIDATSRTRVVGGTQDNGTLVTQDAVAWDTVMNGDAMTTLHLPNEPDVIITAGPRGALMRIELATGFSRRLQAGLVTSEPCEWVAPIVIDPDVPRTMYTGRQRVYRTDNGGDAWRAISPPLSNTVSALAISPADASIIWAGGSYGDIVMSTDAGSTWTSRFTAPLPQQYVSSIACSPRSASTVWVSYASYGTSHVWKSTDLGATWFSVWETMPDVPINTVCVHPDNEDVAFAASDIGVHETRDGGRSWTAAGKGLPRSPVVDAKLDATLGILRVATHGRGVWELPLAGEVAVTPQIVTPAGGEVRYPGQQQVIQWRGLSGRVTIDVSYNDGRTWETIATDVDPSTYRWDVPSRITATARIRIIASEGTSVVSRSFAIELPRRGTILHRHALSWTAYGITWDGGEGLWTTDLRRNVLTRIDRTTYAVTKRLELQGVGDSLFLDLAYDTVQHLIYVHRLNDVQGSSTSVIVVDTNGTVQRTFASGAQRYGLGLALDRGELVGCERDGDQRLVRMNPTTGAVLGEQRLPYATALGPRGMTIDSAGRIHMVTTAFDASRSSLLRADVELFTNASSPMRTSTMPADMPMGPIQARGIERDTRDGSYWITDIDGVVWKIAGDEAGNPPLRINESTSIAADIVITPQPSRDATSLDVHAERDGMLQVDVRDITGAVVFTVPARVHRAGEPTTVRISPGALPAGTYVITAQIAGLAPIRRTFVLVP
jgi:photosystem II stability/assembly factor-like uncharacterized protein